jgi:peroxiredoxin
MDTSSSTAPQNQPIKDSLIRKTLASAGLLLLLAVPVFLLVALQRSANSQMLHAGNKAPISTLGEIDSRGALPASVEGERAAILFFRVDCPHCQNEIPVFNEAERRFGSKVDFIAVALNEKQKSESFIRTHDVRTKILIDEKGIVGKQFGVSEVPALFLVNQDQIIEWVGIGEQSRAEIFRRLGALVARDAPTAAKNSRKITE